MTELFADAAENDKDDEVNVRDEDVQHDEAVEELVVSTDDVVEEQSEEHVGGKRR